MGSSVHNFVEFLPNKKRLGTDCRPGLHQGDRFESCPSQRFVGSFLEREITIANKSLFTSATAKLPRATTLNEAGGRAYGLSPKHALAQLAATGTFNGVFYANAQTQLASIRDLINRIDDNRFLAQLAVYSRQRAYMKDMPAALLVELSTRDNELLHQIFDRVVDNGRMLRTVFQMVRSGQFGRTGLSSSLKRAFQRWFNEASVQKLLSASIGNDPSLRDILRMARPKPQDNMRRALFGWLASKDVAKWAPATGADLPREVQALVAYRNAKTQQEQAAIVADLPVRWDLLADAALGPATWAAIARQMGPQALRMNLNTLQRHGVFDQKNDGVIARISQAIGLQPYQKNMGEFVADKLYDVEAILRSRQFPYQFMAAYMNVKPGIPTAVITALHSAAEVACGQIPVLPGPIVIGLDVSGSMKQAATGNRGRGATSKMRCVDVAALFASAILRNNPQSVVIPFDTRAYQVNVSPGDSVLRLANRLAQFGGGGTKCSLPLETANSMYAERKFAGAIIVSDNQSWKGLGHNGSTATMTHWEQFVANQKRLDSTVTPKLVCIDIQPYTNTQVPDRHDILNVGGFSDAVFKVVSSFLAGDGSRFVDEVAAIEL